MIMEYMEIGTDFKNCHQFKVTYKGEDITKCIFFMKILTKSGSVETLSGELVKDTVNIQKKTFE